MQKLRVDMNMGANLRRLRLEHRYTQDQLVAKLHLLEVPVTRAVCSGTKPGSGISRSAHSSRCISSIGAATTPFSMVFSYHNAAHRANPMRFVSPSRRNRL